MSDSEQAATHDQDSSDFNSAEMHILDHLGELRNRLIVSFAAILIAACFAFLYSRQFFVFLASPYFVAFEGSPLIGTGPAEAFILRLKLAIFGGAVLASPIIFHQIWVFVTPGLHDHEKRLAIPFLVCTTALFLAGISFCFFCVFPFAFEFFYRQYQEIGVSPTIKIAEHLSFVIKILLAFGLIFELPVLAFFLGRLGIITDQFLIDGARYALVIIFLTAAVLTPPDVVTQLLMAGPLMLLYGLSILIVRWSGKK